MSQVSGIIQLIVDRVVLGIAVSRKDLRDALKDTPANIPKLAQAIRDIAEQEKSYSFEEVERLNLAADTIHPPTPAPLNSLNLEELEKKRDKITKRIARLREWWNELSHLANPDYDDTLLKIFAQLDELEHGRLPDIENRLRQPRRAVERAA